MHAMPVRFAHPLIKTVSKNKLSHYMMINQPTIFIVNMSVTTGQNDSKVLVIVQIYNATCAKSRPNVRFAI